MLYRLVIPACVRRSLYEETRSFKTVRSPLSLILSSSFLSLARQKCHTKLQYVRWGSTAVLYIRNFAFIGIRFFSLCRTPIVLLVFVQTSDICCGLYQQFRLAVWIHRESYLILQSSITNSICCVMHFLENDGKPAYFTGMS